MKEMKYDRVTGGEGSMGPFVVLECGRCKEGIQYWDEQAHSWPTLPDLVKASADHYMTHVSEVER